MITISRNLAEPRQGVALVRLLTSRPDQGRNDAQFKARSSNELAWPFGYEPIFLTDGAWGNTAHKWRRLILPINLPTWGWDQFGQVGLPCFIYNSNRLSKNFFSTGNPSNYHCMALMCWITSKFLLIFATSVQLWLVTTCAWMNVSLTFYFEKHNKIWQKLNCHEMTSETSIAWHD